MKHPISTVEPLKLAEPLEEAKNWKNVYGRWLRRAVATEVRSLISNG
jgi:hypothetical protein